MNTNDLTLDGYFAMPFGARLSEARTALPHTADRWREGEQHLDKRDWYCPPTRNPKVSDDYTDILAYLVKHPSWSKSIAWSDPIKGQPHNYRQLQRKSKETVAPASSPERVHLSVEQAGRPSALIGNPEIRVAPSADMWEI